MASSSKQSPLTPHTTTPHHQTSSLSSSFTPSPITPIRTLSKNALYTPLSTYLKPTTTTTTTPNKRIANNIKESTLIEFLQHTNEYYATIRGGGGNVMKKADVENRILQRSMGMLSGTAGITKKRAVRKRKQRPPGGVFHSISNKRRKKKQSREGGCISMLHEPFIKHEILLLLNQAWNTYAHQLVHLLLPSSPIQSCLSVQNNIKLSTHFQKAELVGAHVQIAKCSSRQHLLERRGIVVKITECTWHVAMLIWDAKSAQEEQKSKKEKDVCTEEKEEDKVKKKWKVVVIPKHGTTLALRISLPIQKDMKDEKVKEEKRNDVPKPTAGKKSYESTNVDQEQQAKQGEKLCILIHGS